MTWSYTRSERAHYDHRPGLALYGQSAKSGEHESHRGTTSSAHQASIAERARAVHTLPDQGGRGHQTATEQMGGLALEEARS